MYSLTNNGAELIDIVEKIDIALEEKGRDSIVSSNRANITINRERGKDVDFFTKASSVEIKYLDETLFRGNWNEIDESEENRKSNRDITVFDQLKTVSKRTFEEDEVYLDKSFDWVLNELCSRVNIAAGGTGINFQINYIYWKKGTKIIDEIKELISAVNGSLFANRYNYIQFIRGVSTGNSGITFNENNLTRKVSISTKFSEYDFIRVEYDNFQKLEQQTVFKLANDKRIAENSNGTLLCNYISPACLNVSLKKILIEDANKNILVKKGVFIENGEEIAYDSTNNTVNYNITISQNQVRLEMENTNNFEVFLVDIEFIGEPLVKYEGNWLEWGRSGYSGYTISNRYIQNSNAALELAKAHYKEKCNDIKTYKFTSKVLTGIDVMNTATIDNQSVNINAHTIIIKKINYSIVRKGLPEMTIEADRLIDFSYPANPYIKIEEKIGGNSLESVAVEESKEIIQTKVNSLITEIVDDIGTSENVYEIEVDNYIHSAKPLIRFFAGKVNTGPCNLKINNSNEYPLKKLGWTKDLEENDIVEDMIVLCNFNNRKNVYEILNTVGLVNTINQYGGYADPIAIVNFTKSEVNDLQILLRWDDPNLNLIEEFSLRRKDTPFVVAPYGTDNQLTGDEIFSGTASELNSYLDIDLVDNLSEPGTYYYKMFYKVNGSWQYPSIHNNLTVNSISLFTITLFSIAENLVFDGNREYRMKTLLLGYPTQEENDVVKIINNTNGATLSFVGKESLNWEDDRFSVGDSISVYIERNGSVVSQIASDIISQSYETIFQIKFEVIYPLNSGTMISFEEMWPYNGPFLEGDHILIFSHFSNRLFSKTLTTEDMVDTGGFNYTIPQTLLSGEYYLVIVLRNTSIIVCDLIQAVDVH